MIKILSKIFQINTIQVVGIFKGSDGDRYDLLTAKKSKNKLDIIRNETFNSLEVLLEAVDSKLPIIINLDGKGILNKRINLNNESDLAWQKNLDFKTLYYTSYSQEEVVHMSFCRDNFVEECTSVFSLKRLKVIDVYIGSFLSVLLDETLKKKNILSGNLNLIIENGKINSFTKSDLDNLTNYTIDNYIINNYSLPLFSVALNYFIENDSVQKTNWDETNIEEFVYFNAFNTVGITILVGFFIALLFSYSLIQYFGSKNAELNIQNVYSNKSYQQIVDLEKQKEDKIKIIKESGFLSEKHLTYYSYEILNSIPNSISLSELNIAPLIKEIKSNEKVEVEAGIVLVSGKTIDEEEFNEWLNELKTLDWIVKFEIESLNKDKKSNTKFKLRIFIK